MSQSPEIIDLLTNSSSSCEFIIAIVGTAAPDSGAAGYVLVVFVCIYIAFFASTWGPAAWVIIGEIYSLPIRAKGVAMSTASNWYVLRFYDRYAFHCGVTKHILIRC